jgi:hypothetical protein
MDASDFNTNKGGLTIRPKDPFSHAGYMVQESDNDKISAFSMLCDRWVMLSNLSGDLMMRYYQTDIQLLTMLYGMALNNPKLFQMFQTFYYGWKGELGITRAKDGDERKQQGQINGGQQSNRTGWGNQLDEAKLREWENSLLGKLRGGQQ